MFIQMLPQEQYTKADNRILTHKELSDGAKVLYFTLCSFRFGSSKWETKIKEMLMLSHSSYARRKRELIKVGLIEVVQTGPRNYTMYVGNSKVSAKEVRAIKELVPQEAH